MKNNYYYIIIKIILFIPENERRALNQSLSAHGGVKRQRAARARRHGAPLSFCASISNKNKNFFMVDQQRVNGAQRGGGEINAVTAACGENKNRQ